MQKTASLFVAMVLLLMPQGRVLGVDCVEMIFKLVDGQSSTTIEMSLRNMGYSARYTDGLDQIDSHLQAAKELRRPGVDPHTTHIPFFAGQIDKHINFIESDMPPEVRAALQEGLRILKKRAYLRREQLEVTYAWWVEWNVQLAILITRKEHPIVRLNPDMTFPELEPLRPMTPMQLHMAVMRGDKDKIDIQAYHRRKLEYEYRQNLERALSRFPEVIMMPTTDHMGLMAFNRTFPLGISFLGLLNDSVQEASASFLFHDITHLLERLSEIKQYGYVDIAPVHNAFISKIEELPKDRREAVEYLYFLAHHEYPSLFIPIMTTSSGKKMRRFLSIALFREQELQDNFDAELRKLLPNDVDSTSDHDIAEFLRTDSDFAVRIIQENNNP